MRVDRLLSMLLIISNKGMVTGKELAEHFEVSIRTIYRDIDKICEAGVPIAAVGGKGGGYSIMENYNLDNLFLNRNEIRELMPLMDNMKFIFGKKQQFNDIILKFENLYKEEEIKNTKLSINMSHFSMENELKEYLFLMNKAIEESRLLEFNYINRRMEYSQRIAEPSQIAFNYGEWYLSAFCRSRNDYRKFKLVRMRNLKLGDYFTKKDISKEELKKIFNEAYNKKSIKVVLRFTNRIGEQLKEYFPKENIKKLEDDSFIAWDLFPYEEGLIKFILGFGNDCEVVEPHYLREETKRYLKELLKKYSD
jgi:predicted DNA-binding transcriptional regulator YafY